MDSIKSFILKNRQPFIISIAILLGIVGLAILYYVLEVTPVSNDECLWVHEKVAQDSIVVKITNIKVNGVTWNAGIRNGDHLLAINNIRVPNVEVASIVLNDVDAGDYARYTIERNGKIFKTKVFIKKLVSYANLGFTLLGLIWLAVGFIVVMSKPAGKVQWLFFEIGAVFILFLTVIFNRFRHMWDNADIGLVNIIWVIASIYLPFLILNFFLVFPKPFRFMEKKWVQKLFIFIPLSVSVIVVAVALLSQIIIFKPFIFFTVISIVNYSLIGSFIIGLIALHLNYRRLKTPQEKKPIKVILFSYLLGNVSLVYFYVIATVKTDSVFNSPELFLPIILVIALPISFGYSIFKYQLMDVSIVIKNAIVYGTATVAIAAIYFLSVYGIGQGISSAFAAEYRSAIAAAAFVIFAMVFQSTKDKFQDLLTKKFYPEQFTYQKVILKFSRDVVSIVGLEKILDSMKETFVSALKINRFGILLKAPKEPVFKLKREFNISDESFIIKESQALTDFVREQLLLNKPISVDRQQFRELFNTDCNQLSESEIYTIIPMIIKSKIIGLLVFGLKHAGSQFAGKDLDLLCVAANQAAVSIENARLYESELQRISIEHDLDNARKIQESLLPKKIPSLQGVDIHGIMISAMQVGGDYYDYIQVSPDKLFVVVGDVSGKGLSASLYMSKLQTMMSLYCSENKTPKEILVEVNKKIYESIERNWFITVNLALIDTAEKTITFCRAGHCPIIEVSDGFMNLYQSKGIGVGLEEGKIFSDTLEEVKLNYQQGNMYAFISDGVTEAMNSDNQLFGIDRFSKILVNQNGNSSKEVLQKILSSINEFKGEREQNDDITIVLLKIV